MVTIRPLIRALVSLATLLVTPEAQARIELSPQTLASVATSAKNRVDVMLPKLDDASLVDGLKSLAKSGRRVRILVSQSEEGLAAWECLACSALEASGADLRYLDQVILDTFMLVDGPRSRMASGDLATLAVQTGRTDSTRRILRFSREGDYALSYQHEFDDLWVKAHDYGNKAKDRIQRELRNAGGPYALFSSTNMTPMALPKGQWAFAPTIDSKNAIFGDYIAGAIDYAYSQVDVGAYGLNRPEVFAAIDRALARGVRVRILVEETVKDPVANLAARGATVVSLSGLGASGSTPRLPTNVVLIDDKIAITGNFAWSRAAELRAFSSLLTLRGPVVDQYRAWLNYGFAKAQTKLPLTTRAMPEM